MEWYSRASRSNTYVHLESNSSYSPDQSKQRSEDIERTFELNLWGSHDSLCLCDDDRSVHRVVPMFVQVSTFLSNVAGELYENERDVLRD